MGTGVSFEVPELYGAIVGAADNHFLRVLNKLCDMGSMLIRELPDEVASGYVPYFDALVEAGA